MWNNLLRKRKLPQKWFFKKRTNYSQKTNYSNYPKKEVFPNYYNSSGSRKTWKDLANFK